jgi:hypothetical protein
MTKQQQQMMQHLKNVAESSIAWDFQNVNVHAIKFALSEIERLTTENRRLQDEVALLSGIVRDLENCDD